MEDLSVLIHAIDNFMSIPFDVYGFTLTFKGLFIFSMIVIILGSIVSRIFFSD